MKRLPYLYRALFFAFTGSISFGLVNIPIKLYAATNSREYVFNQLCEKGHRIRYKKWCPEEEREVPYSEIKKGYEIEKDNYVVFEKEELNKVKLKTTHSIKLITDKTARKKTFSKILVAIHEPNYLLGQSRYDSM